ncbi:hypothetical protein M0638_26870, partial [Roseomonas sp. NAR14]
QDPPEQPIAITGIRILPGHHHPHMPQVPYAFEGSRVRANGTVSPTIPAGAFGEQIGQAAQRQAEALAQGGQALQRVAGGLDKVAAEADRYVQAGLAQEKLNRNAAALTDINTAVAGVLRGVSAAPDADAVYSTWDRGLAEARDVVVRGGRDQEEKDWRRARFDLAASGHLSWLDGQARTRRAQGTTAALDAAENNVVNLAVQSTNPEQLRQAREDYHQMLGAAAGFGVIGADEVQRREARVLSRADEAQFESILATDPARAEAMLSNPANFPNLPATRRGDYLMRAQARNNSDLSRAQVEDNARRQEETRARRQAADQAVLKLIDAERRGDAQAAQAGLAELRASGEVGTYAQWSDRINGRPQSVTSAQRDRERLMLEERFQDMTNPLSRQELQQMRARGDLSDASFTYALRRLDVEQRSDVRDALSAARSRLSVPSPLLRDDDLQPWQRSARTEYANLRDRLGEEMERRRAANESFDPRAFVNDQLRALADPIQQNEIQNAQARVSRNPPEVRTPEGLAAVRGRFAAYQEYRGLGWWERQSATTVPPPRVTMPDGTVIPVDADRLAQWTRDIEQSNQPTRPRLPQGQPPRPGARVDETPSPFAPGAQR